MDTDLVKRIQAQTDSIDRLIQHLDVLIDVLIEGMDQDQETTRYLDGSEIDFQ